MAKILVAEDEEVVRLLLQEMLRTSFKCRVHVAPNGAEALALVDQHAYDLVISDIRMPVMAGTELYLRLREIQPLLARRFAFITGHPGEQSLQEEIARWDVPVLAKPFEVGRLIELCRPLLARSELLRPRRQLMERNAGTVRYGRPTCRRAPSQAFDLRGRNGPGHIPVRS